MATTIEPRTFTQMLAQIEANFTFLYPAEDSNEVYLRALDALGILFRDRYLARVGTDAEGEPLFVPRRATPYVRERGWTGRN